jgi:hypothetical protein
MPRWTTLALTAALLCGAPLSAQDKKAPARPLGAWARDADGVKVQFAFTDGELRCTIGAGDAVLDVRADYAVSKDGVLFGRVTGVEKKGIDAGPAIGDLFSFRYEVKDKVLSISNLRGTGSAADGAAVVEGDYKQAPAKKDKAEK